MDNLSIGQTSFNQVNAELGDFSCSISSLQRPITYWQEYNAGLYCKYYGPEIKYCINTYGYNPSTYKLFNLFSEVCRLNVLLPVKVFSDAISSNCYCGCICKPWDIHFVCFYKILNNTYLSFRNCNNAELYRISSADYSSCLSCIFGKVEIQFSFINPHQIF